MADLPDITSNKSGTWNRNRTDRKFLYNKKAFKSIIKADKHEAAGTMISYHKPAAFLQECRYENKEFWKGAVAGALVVTCIGTGAFAGTGLAAKGTALGDRKCTSKLAYLEELIDRYYLGDKG